MSGREFVDTNILVRNALIVRAALIRDCGIPNSEDMQHDHVIDTATIANPFVDQV